MRSIEWRDGDIVIIDQTALPGRLELLTLSDTDAVAAAIKTMRVRGAPALGIIGAMGVAQAAYRPPAANPKAVIERGERAAEALTATRPTAVNLAWATERVLAKGRAIPLTAGPLRIAQSMVDEALAIQLEDEEACNAMAKNAHDFFRPKGVVLTHCNTGFLCTGGDGTALGAIKYAHEQRLGVVVIATETRPLLQGARLTTWELARLGIPHALVVDSAAPGLIARGEVSMVIVGADRIAANGDVANKVGTYPLALAASAAKVPFVVVAPTSTIDLSITDGSKIEVEERGATEVTTIGTVSIAPPGTQAINPAFDITPGALVTAIVTERGVARAPVGDSLRRMLKGGRSSSARATSSKRASRPAAPKRAAPKRAAPKKPAPAKKAPARAAKKAPARKAAPKKASKKTHTKRARRS